MARFVPASSCPPRADHRDCRAFDARHGRVLFSTRRRSVLYVWDPVTEDRWDLPTAPLHRYSWQWNAAVLCAATSSCDHLHCHGGPFLVILIDAGGSSNDLYVSVYSSEAGAWSKLSYVVEENQILMQPAALVGNALYFLVCYGTSILKYDLATQGISVIDRRGEVHDWSELITTKDGGLGIATLSVATLSLWSLEATADGDSKWALIRVVNLRELFPFPTFFQLVGFAHDMGVSLVRMKGGVFSIDMKSDRVKKVWEVCDDSCVLGAMPCMSFYTPVLRAAFTCEEPGVGDSSA
ncbi:hypothetical protein ACP70R_014600 [Stipagrostis hirtigluma subsp. patula]